MSDQDFFFDEEDEKPGRAEKAAPKSSPKPAGSKASAPNPAPARTSVTNAAAEDGILTRELTFSIGAAALAVVCALLLGIVFGLFIGQSRGQLSSGTPAPSATSVPGQATAPQLTQDQLSSGKLPPGHPSLGATGSKTATGK